MAREVRSGLNQEPERQGKESVSMLEGDRLDFGMSGTEREGQREGVGCSMMYVVDVCGGCMWRWNIEF